jgi:hypothetical protein
MRGPSYWQRTSYTIIPTLFHRTLQPPDKRAVFMRFLPLLTAVRPVLKNRFSKADPEGCSSQRTTFQRPEQDSNSCSTKAFRSTAVVQWDAVPRIPTVLSRKPPNISERHADYLYVRSLTVSQHRAYDSAFHGRRANLGFG